MRQQVEHTHKCIEIRSEQNPGESRGTPFATGFHRCASRFTRILFRNNPSKCVNKSSTPISASKSDLNKILVNREARLSQRGFTGVPLDSPGFCSETTRANASTSRAHP